MTSKNYTNLLDFVNKVYDVMAKGYICTLYLANPFRTGSYYFFISIYLELIFYTAYFCFY
jgi:hypothetical protein